MIFLGAEPSLPLTAAAAPGLSNLGHLQQKLLPTAKGGACACKAGLSDTGAILQACDVCVSVDGEGRRPENLCEKDPNPNVYTGGQ